jgi:hypothetical protein
MRGGYLREREGISDNTSFFYFFNTDFISYSKEYFAKRINSSSE